MKKTPKNVIELLRILDKQSISAKILIKDTFGLTTIKNIYYDSVNHAVIMEIEE